MGGQIVDVEAVAPSIQACRRGLVAAPKQRNTDSEKTDIKNGKSAVEIWPDESAKAPQKEVDARWTVKFAKARPVDEGHPKHLDNAIATFGCKNHAAIDQRHGFIRGWNVTSAAAYDGAQHRNVVVPGNTGSKVWADNQTTIGRHTGCRS